jgi:uncharacterized protein (TIGR00369 family)
MTAPETPADVLAKRRADLVALFHSGPISRLFGMTLSYSPDGAAVFDLPYNPHLDHGLKATHGGVIATLLDNAGWFTIAPHVDAWIATVEFSVRLHQPAVATHLTARGELVRLGRRLSVARMAVRTPEGALVATGEGTFTVTAVGRP